MEKVGINSDDINIFNYRQLSLCIADIKKKHFFDNKQIIFLLHVFYFRKISNHIISFQLLINDLKFNIIYDLTLSMSKENKKQQKRELCGIIVEELIEHFQPLKEITFHSDNLNYSGEYTIKHIVNDCKHKYIENLELNNYLITLHPQSNQNLLFLKSFSDKIQIKKLTLNFQILDEEKVNLEFLLKNLVNMNSNSINISIYYKGKIDPPIISEPYSNLEELKLKFINFNPYNNNDLEYNKIPMVLLENYFPDYLEITHVEILNINQCTVFKSTKIIYSKRFYCILNSLKNKFKSNNQFSREFKLNYKIFQKLRNFLNLKEDDIFDVKSQFLRMLIPENIQQKENESKYLKFIFNLTQDFESLLIRKIKYEDIIKMIITKPQQDDINQTKNLLKFKKFDLNSTSKILSKIEGNIVLTLKNGRKLSIAGKLSKTINQDSVSVAINTIIEMNRTFSMMKILTFKDNYFLPHFHSAADILDDDHVILVGGISTQELLPNFSYTPIYKINIKLFTICRIVPSVENTFYPGVIFNHKIKVHSDSNTFEVSEGYLIANYSRGLNLNDSQKLKPKVEQNMKIFEYDLRKNIWLSK